MGINNCIDIDSVHGFAVRAEIQLNYFKENFSPKHLIYAAIELRMGIEARLSECVDDCPRKWDSFKNMFKRLCKNDPDVVKSSTSFFVIDGQKFPLVWNPNIDQLAKDYSTLNKMLHFSLFRKAKHCGNYYLVKGKKYLPKFGNKKCFLNNYLDVLEKIQKNLSIRGNLSAPPKLKKDIQHYIVMIKKVSEHCFEGFVYENKEKMGREYETTRNMIRGKTLKEAKENASKKLEELFGYSGEISSWKLIK